MPIAMAACVFPLSVFVFCLLHSSQAAVRMQNNDYDIAVGTNGDVLLWCISPSDVKIEWLQDGKVINTSLDGYDASPPVQYDQHQNYNYLRIDSIAKGNGGTFTCRNVGEPADTSDILVKVSTAEALRLSVELKSESQIGCLEGIALVCSTEKHDVNVSWYLNGEMLYHGSQPELDTNVGQITKVQKPDRHETHLRLEYALAKKIPSMPLKTALKDRTYTFFCRQALKPRHVIESNHISVRGGAASTSLAWSASFATILMLLFLQAMQTS